MPIERFPEGTEAIPYPHNIMHWKRSGDITINVMVGGGGWFGSDPPPVIPGFRHTFTAYYGQEQTVYSYHPTKADRKEEPNGAVTSEVP